ncbi:MAG: hypothetical protein MZV64_19345 [Ignavibacteriales bacterium]|nr:hypothetical protein [Ignavibacteriales bacterium]
MFEGFLQGGIQQEEVSARGHRPPARGGGQLELVVTQNGAATDAACPSLRSSSQVPSVREKFSSRLRVHGLGAELCQMETLSISLRAASRSGTVLCRERTMPLSEVSFRVRL